MRVGLMIQNMNDQFGQEFESRKRYQIDNKEIKNSSEHMGSRNDQCKNTSQLEDKVAVSGKLFRDDLENTKT